MQDESLHGPSWRGWLAIGLALLDGFFLPMSFTAQGVAASASEWSIAVLVTAVCLGASIFAALSRRTGDAVLGVLASFLAGWMFFGFINSAT